jgi:hypothetical protein
MRPAPDIVWFVESRGVTLAGPGGILRLSIPYPFAALWALIANGNYSPAFAVELMMALAPLSREQAHALVADTIHHWRETGILGTD